MPDSLITISGYAFYECTSLKNVVIGKGIKYIYDSAFRECTSLKDVYYTGSDSDWAEINTVDSWIKGAKIHFNYVP